VGDFIFKYCYQFEIERCEIDDDDDDDDDMMMI